MIDSAFCAGAAMISFGAVLGKVSPTQLTYLLVLEVSPKPFHLNLLTHQHPPYRAEQGGPNTVDVSSYPAFTS